MRKTIRFTLVSAVVLALSACNLFSPNPGVSGVSVVRLTVRHKNATETFNSVGQVINYEYEITNTGTSPLAGPVIVADPQRQFTCPALDDNDLDPGEITICTGTYAITQADLNTGSVINIATATVGTIVSNPSGVTVTLNAAPSSVLKLTITADRTTYTASGETIKYTYVITNTGTTPLPPSQFTITDNRLGPSLNCGPAGTTLIKDATISCTFDYFITPADMAVASLTNSATASGRGVPPSPAASATVTNLTVITATPTSTSSPSSNLVPGTTIQHQVVKGEWLIQIARCYGANFEEVRKANPQILDPHFILPDMTVSVPHIGSVGRIYGRPCISSYTVQSGDTWNSIAQKPEHNADVEVLQTRNPGALLVGRVLIIPLNSAGGSSTPVATPIQTIRLNIPPGSTSVTQPGTLAPQGIVRYLVNATQGQIMTVTVTAPANAVAMAVYDPGGTAIKSADATLTWSGTIPQTGDYRIDIGSVTSSTSVLYTLVVSLTTPALPITPTPTPTNTPAAASSLQQAADINGAGSSNPLYLAEYKGLLYFQADDGKGAGKELWKYDGTKPTDALNPSRVADINTTGDSNPAYLTVYKDVLYFQADDGKGTTGKELWKYDSTKPVDASNPSVVADIIRPGKDGSNPAYLTVYNDVLYFSADDGVHGTELWKYDTTPPVGAADINGTGSSSPAVLTVYNGLLYFRDDDGKGAGQELWKYDSTKPVDASNPSRVADIATAPAKGSFPAYLTEYNGALYFSADDGKGTTGKELWKYDSTKPIDASNPAVVADIWIGQNGSNPAYLTKYNGWLYFSADDGTGRGIELLRYKNP